MGFTVKQLKKIVHHKNQFLYRICIFNKIKVRHVAMKAYSSPEDNADNETESSASSSVLFYRAEKGN